MVSLNDAVVARLKKHGKHFEVLVDCNAALRLRDGRAVDMQDVLAAERIFSEQSKGVFAADSALKEVFGTNDVEIVAKEIILHGELQLTAAYRAQLREMKRKRLIEILHANAVDPQTNLPHPVKRIELAFESAHIHPDDAKSAEAQLDEVFKKLQPILPMRFARKRVQVHLFAHEAEKAHKKIVSFGTKLSEEWNNDGSCTIVLEIPAGLQTEFFDFLNRLTNGNNETVILNK